MKRIFIFLLAFALLFSSLAGCKDEEEAEAVKTEFTITIGDVIGGTLTADKTTVKVGEGVSFNFHANEGFMLYAFKINGGKISLVNNDSENYTYSMSAVMSDVTATVEFVDPRVTVKFDPTSLCSEAFDDKAVKINEPYGELPVPFVAGYRFIGWLDEDGVLVTDKTLVNKSSLVTLTAKFVEYDASFSADLKPFSMTATYYDKDCTQYGVVWNTNEEPITSAIQIVEKTGAQTVADADFTNARNIGTYMDTIFDRYLSTGVIDQLKFETTYFVRVGDLAADVWSDVYEFTTREENPDDTKFLYFTDAHVWDWASRYSYETPKGADGTVINKTFYKAMIQDAGNRFGSDNIDMIINGGDFFRNAASASESRDALTDLQDIAFDYPTQVVSGNHDSVEYGGGIEILGRLYHYDSQKTAGSLDGGATHPIGDYYSFNYGKVHFIALNSNEFYTATFNSAKPFKFELSQEQHDWLVNDLQTVDKTKTPWIVAYIHDSFINPQDKYYQPETLSEEMLGIFEQGGVDLMLFGHIHRNLLTYPIIYDEGNAEYAYQGAYITPTTTTVTTEEYQGTNLEKFVYPTTGARGTVCYASDSGQNSGSYFSYAERYGYTKAEAIAKFGTQQDAIDAYGNEYAYASGYKGYINPEDWSDTMRYVASGGVGSNYETSASVLAQNKADGTYLKRFPVKYIRSFWSSWIKQADLDAGTLPSGLKAETYYSTYNYVEVKNNKLVLRKVLVDSMGLIKESYDEGADWVNGYGFITDGFVIEK